MTRTLPRQPPARTLTLAAVILSSLAIAARSQADKPPRPTFATVAIHPTLANRHVSGISISPPGRFTATATTAQDLIFYAYDERTIDGGPDWMASARFDIDAKIDDSAVAAWKKLSSLERDNQTRGMVRALLEDKFKLQVKHEKQDSEVYALVVAKDGAKLTPSPIVMPAPRPTSHTARTAPQLKPGLHTLTARNMTMLSWVDQLANQPDIDRIVIDRTGLSGIFDFTLTWSPAKDSSGPTVFQALEDQLGLKLEPTNASVEVLVIDAIERPR